MPGKIVKEWMLTEDIIHKIERCRRKIPIPKSAEYWCKSSEHSCWGIKPKTKDYKAEYFECLCLCYAGLCPKGIKPRWERITMEMVK